VLNENACGIHITMALLCALLLTKPFDCFNSGPFPQKAADCCKKGKCVPSSNADDCCKGTLPGGNQLVASDAPPHSTPAMDLIVSNILSPVTLSPVFCAAKKCVR